MMFERSSRFLRQRSWQRMGRGTKALAASLAVGLGMSACSRDYTVAYLYVTTASANPGLIDAYQIDYQLGSLVPLTDSPIPSGGRNPVGLAVTTNTSYTNGKQYVYVINHDDSDVVEFAVGTDGKLYPTNTYNTVTNAAKTVTGTFPTALALDPSGKFLYVTLTFGNGFSSAHPGTGGLAVFPINTDGTLGAALVNTTVGTTTSSPLPYYPVGNNPVGVAISNSFCLADQTGATYSTATCTPSVGGTGHVTIPNVYVVDQDNLSGVPTGIVLSFQENATSGALTPVTGPSLGGFQAGAVPSAIAVDPTGRFVYITDRATNQIFGDLVGTGGVLSAMTSSPFTTGLVPLGLTVDPRGAFVYVANSNSGTVSGYAINGATGSLSASGSGTATGTAPNCVTIEPALGKYLYTSNNLGNTVSGMQLDVHTGALTLIQGTPYNASALPTCAAAVANGAHATQLVVNQ